MCVAFERKYRTGGTGAGAGRRLRTRTVLPFPTHLDTILLRTTYYSPSSLPEWQLFFPILVQILLPFVSSFIIFFE